MATTSQRNKREAWRTAKATLTESLAIAVAVADGIPVPGLKSVLNVALRVVNGLEKCSSNAETLKRLEMEVKLLNDTISKRTAYDSPKELTSDVESLQSDIQGLVAVWDGRSSRGRFRRFLDNAADETELRNFLENLHLALSKFQVALQISVRQAIARLEMQSKRAFVLQHLPYAADAHHASVGGRMRSTCLKDTRVALLEQIMAWIKSKDPPTQRVFWLNGMAGTGKTTIAQTVAIMAEELGYLVGSFFFSRDFKELEDATLVFPTIARQLAARDDIFMSAVWDVLAKDPSYGRRGPSQQFQKLIMDPIFCMDTSRPIVLFLDAVDESIDEKITVELLQRLCDIASNPQFPAHLRIFITSRPEPHIRSVFKEKLSDSGFILHNVDDAVIRADIMLYLQVEMSRIYDQLGIGRPDNWPAHDDLQFLAEKSDKLFIYAATAIRFIGDTYACNPDKQLSIIRGLRPSSKNPHAALDTLYTHVLTSAFPQGSTDDDDIQLLRSVMGGVLFLYEPFTLDGLARFFDLDRRDVNNVLHRLHSIILVPPNFEPEKGPRIYHPSFTEFIVDSGRCKDKRFVLRRDSRELTSRCLRLMCSPHLQSSVAERRAYKHEFVYSCANWHYHFFDAQPVDQEVYRLLQEFNIEVFSDILSVDRDPKNLEDLANFLQYGLGHLKTVPKPFRVPGIPAVVRMAIGAVFSLVKISERYDLTAEAGEELKRQVQLLSILRDRVFQCRIIPAPLQDRLAVFELELQLLMVDWWFYFGTIRMGDDAHGFRNIDGWRRLLDMVRTLVADASTEPTEGEDEETLAEWTHLWNMKLAPRENPLLAWKIREPLEHSNDKKE